MLAAGCIIPGIIMRLFEIIFCKSDAGKDSEREQSQSFELK